MTCCFTTLSTTLTDSAGGAGEMVGDMGAGLEICMCIVDGHLGVSMTGKGHFIRKGSIGFFIRV